MKEFFKNKKNIVLLVLVFALVILEIAKFFGSVLIIYAAVIFELLLILIAIIFYCTKKPTKVLTIVSLTMCVAFLIPNLIVFRKGASAQTGYVLHAGGGNSRRRLSKLQGRL